MNQMIIGAWNLGELINKAHEAIRTGKWKVVPGSIQVLTSKELGRPADVSQCVSDYVLLIERVPKTDEAATPEPGNPPEVRA